MDEKTPVLLQEALALPDLSGVNNEYIKTMLGEDTPVLCINRSEHKQRYVPFKSLYGNNKHFWLLAGGWKYYLTGEDLAKIKNKSAVSSSLWETITGKVRENRQILPGSLPEPDYGTGYEAFAAMSRSERVKRINEGKRQLDELISHKIKDKKIITGALVNTARDAVQINRSTLLEAMNFQHNDAVKFTQDLVDSTCGMVKASVNLISQDILNNELMNTLVEKSNGTTIRHMTKVYLNGVAFLSYYNKLVSQTSAISKFRVSFAAKYRDFYHSLLPNIDFDDLNLERVFRKGMRAISPENFCRWAVGFLIHDIGKAPMVDYHEGETSYNRNVVIEHVRLGYNSIMNKTNFPKEASLIVGSHHEYYGDPDGYGYSRAFLERYKKMNPDARQNYCIAYELDSMMDYETIAYFPAKILEIVDVYDSLTDPNRKYRKPMSREEAITMISDEFIKNRCKIDMILFDIFVSFMQENRTGL